MRLGRRGSSFLELMIAVVVMAIAVIGVFSVASNTTRISQDFDYEEAKDASIQALSAALRLYVTADPGPATASMAPGGSWALPGDVCAWALAAPPACPEHDGSRFLDPRLSALRPGTRLYYRVSRADDDSHSSVVFEVRP